MEDDPPRKCQPKESKCGNSQISRNRLQDKKVNKKQIWTLNNDKGDSPSRKHLLIYLHLT